MTKEQQVLRNEDENLVNNKPTDTPIGWNCNENAIEFLRGQKTATITLSSKRLRNRIYTYQKKYPDDVEILSDKDGVLYAHIPTSWIRLVPPQQRTLSEEEKEAARIRLAKYRKNTQEK